VEAPGVWLGSAAALFLAANLGGQIAKSTWSAGLLPPDARIIEIADLKVGRSTDRGLILWMLHPKRVDRLETGDGGCSDWVYGDFWYGPARLSLLDLAHKRLVNTIEIRGMYEGAQEKEHDFPIPFRVSNGLYYVPQVSGNKVGQPKILNLRDLTGEGVAGQFALFEYEACENYLTTAIGYSRRSDRAVQYGIETLDESGKPKVVSWVEKVFQEKPNPPGHWDFTWKPGHGFDGTIHEQVSFDPARQVFVRR
jgi:hypothetical protein